MMVLEVLNFAFNTLLDKGIENGFYFQGVQDIIRVSKIRFVYVPTLYEIQFLRVTKSFMLHKDCRVWKDLYLKKKIDIKFVRLVLRCSLSSSVVLIIIGLLYIWFVGFMGVVHLWK